MTTATEHEALAPTEPAESQDPMAHVRPAVPAGAQLARARVLGALFGDDRTVGAFGRFRVLERLGAGGMGVVYEAYDPDLARGVALKLVNVAASDRETALAEAKALARLSHPNVVPIYDVGLERDHVYLVMELVRGQTLRAWTEHRSLAEILAVYHQAGLALVAAHAAGLVHRDFKPDNAIVGVDGRVRVVDFGLACEADDPADPGGAPRRPAGTPRFMAPEIKAGRATTPAADQYSFSVALAESLERARVSPPRRITAILERGRAAEVAERFATMTELLRVLARDPARTRRRIVAGVGVAASIGAAAFLLGRSAPAAVDRCDGGAARLDAGWPLAARGSALQRLATLGPYGAALRPQLARALDAHAARWVEHDRAACVDRHRGVVSDTLADRRTACLAQGTDALATVGALVRHAAPGDLIELPRAVQSIPDPAACSDLKALASDVAPPSAALAAPIAAVQRAITQGRIEVGAGRYSQALVTASDALSRARHTGYGPVIAEALLLQGHARMMSSRRDAVPILAEATQLALSVHADALAIEAWARRAFAQGTTTDPYAAVAGLDVIEPLARRTTSATFARALLYNNLGSVALGRDDLDGARAYFTRALAESQQATGRDQLELVAIRANLGAVASDRAEGDRLIDEAADDLAERLGADHPDVLTVREQRGFVTIDNLRAAEALLAPLCSAFDRHVGLEARAARCWTEVGLVDWDLGETEAALRALARTAPTARSPETAAYLRLLGGEARAAADEFAAAIADRPPAPGDSWWDRLARARLTLGLGRARRQLGDLRGAREALTRCVRDLDAIARAHPVASYERRLGRARVELALTLTAMAVPAPQRAAISDAAVAWLQRTGGSPAELALLQADRARRP